MNFDDHIIFYKLRKRINSTFSPYSSDNDPGKPIEKELQERDVKYTALLKLYVQITKIRCFVKELHKWVFFWLIVVGSYHFLRLVYNVVNPILDNGNIGIIIEAMPVIITALVAFVSAIIAIPLTITKFLFNTAEDDNITEVIKHTQEHDSAARDLFKERFLRPKREEFSSSKSDDD